MKIDDLEYINAHGPYDHGIWEGSISNGNKIKIGNKAHFKNRPEWLVDRTTKFLLKEFSKKELKKMTILDVGCYDGWILTKISNVIEFKEAVGVEPREKNIVKGEIGRKINNIKTKTKFIKGDVFNLNKIFRNKSFDIVLSLGMLHHVTSTYDAIKQICNQSSKIVIIDSMIIPELKNDLRRLKKFVNTKDVIYHNEKELWSVAAFKYETNCSDGSRIDTGLVNVPSAGLIEMCLKQLGFCESQILGDESDYYSVSKQNIQGIKEFFAVSKRVHSISSIEKKME